MGQPDTVTFEVSQGCESLFDCTALCQGEVTCAAIAWAASPDENHDGCKNAGLPRCVRYLTSSGQAAAGTSAYAQEYTCYSMLPLPPTPDGRLSRSDARCAAHVLRHDASLETCHDLNRDGHRRLLDSPP